jgi:hypothetical protein
MRFLPLFLCGFLLVPASAYSFSIGKVKNGTGAIVRWHVSTVTYHLHPAGSADIVDGSDLNAVRAGFQQWNDVSCSSLNFVEGNAASNSYNMSVGAQPNDLNEISWAEGSEWQLGSYVLGLTSTIMNAETGALGESDIAFNGYLNKWSTNGASGTVDVLNVTTHEQGHFFGAQHVLGGYDPNNPPTMAPQADPYLKSQTIEADDKNCACFLNPAGEYYCQSDADCPYVNETDGSGNESYVAKLTCINNLCGGTSAQIPEGTKGFGEMCASDWDCKQPYMCQQTGTGGICTQECNTDANCPSGYKCLEYSNAPGGVCYPDSGGTGPGATKDNGQACNNPEECKSGLCVGSFNGASAYCRQPCQVGMNNCLSGESCNQLQGTSSGACIPSSGSGANKGPGEDCTSPSECQSGLCVGLGAIYKCREACSPALGDCPANYDCYPLQGSSGGACIPSTGGPAGKGELGETCEVSSDCVSGFCLSIVGENGAYCSQACGSPNECPCGMQCTDFVGGQSYCVVGGSQACTPSGNPCVSSAECISQACIDGICREPCVVGGSSCPPGQDCLRVKAGSSSGMCSPIGGTALGGACTWDSECQSLLCESMDGGPLVCVQPCDPLSTYCGEGRTCLHQDGPGLFICVDIPSTNPDPIVNPEPSTNPDPNQAPPLPSHGTSGGCQSVQSGGSAAGPGVLVALGLFILLGLRQARLTLRSSRSDR